MSDSANSRAIRDRRKRLGVGAAVLALALAGVWWFLQPSRAELEQSVFDAVSRRDLDEAERLLLRIRPRDPEVVRLLADITAKNGHQRESVHWQTELAEQSTQPIDGYLSTARQAFDWGLAHEAESLNRRAIAAQPQDLRGYSQLARLYLICQRERDLRLIIAQADQAGAALERDPLLLWLWVIGDQVHWLDEDSTNWLIRARTHQPADPFITAALLRHSATSGTTGMHSVQDSETDQSVSPKWPIVLAEAALQQATGGPEGKRPWLDRLEDEGEQAAETWFLRGRWWQEAGDEDAALQAFELAQELNPWLASAAYEAGRLWLRKDPHRGEQLLHTSTQTDDLMRGCLQAAQAERPPTEDLLRLAEIGRELHAERWVQLVCHLIERQTPDVVWPDSVRELRGRRVTPLTVATPALDRGWKLLSQPRTQRASPGSRPAVAVSSSLQFTETTASLGLRFNYEYGHSSQRWLLETLGGGVAVLDYDSDGWPDLFFAQGGDLRAGEKAPLTGELWRNEQGQALRPASAVAHVQVAKYSHGCAVGDVNNDGFADLLVCHFGGLTLLLNQGDGTWLDATESYGLTNDAWNTSATFCDLDRDGDLDLYVARYCEPLSLKTARVCQAQGRSEPCRPNAYSAGVDVLFENTGDEQFVARPEALDSARQAGYGLGVVAADFDADGVSEVFVGNDTTPNFLWKRESATDGLSSFVDVALISGVAVDATGRADASMGIACGDVNGDGLLDFFVTTFFDETCNLFVNRGGGQFTEQASEFGLSNSGSKLMGWGSELLDADNDGWLDLVLLNGHLHDQAQRPQLFHFLNGRFAEVSSCAGPYFQQRKLGRSLATWDYNCDGRTDLIASHQHEPASTLLNTSQAGNSLTLRLIGTTSPRDATGTMIRVRVGTRWMTRLVSPQGGYLSANSSEVIVGLGEATRVDELQILWPSGARQSWQHLPARQSLLICEGEPTVIAVHYK